MDTLVVVVELDIVQWQRSSSHTDPLSLSDFLSHLVAFLNTYSAASSDNVLAVFAAFPGKSVMLYSSTDTQQQTLVSGPNSYPPLQLLDDAVVSSIVAQLDSLDHKGPFFHHLSHTLLMPGYSPLSPRGCPH